MTNSDVLYAELKPDVDALTKRLFEFSELFLKKRGKFLPHAAVLTEAGKVKPVMAESAINEGPIDRTELLPALHKALRRQAAEEPVRAVGVAENVVITLEGQGTTHAVKVLYEHKRGLAIALYLPFKKKLFNRYTFGAAFPTSTQPQINAWPNHAA